MRDIYISKRLFRFYCAKFTKKIMNHKSFYGRKFDISAHIVAQNELKVEHYERKTAWYHCQAVLQK